ncbi:hypothetical protein HS1genome_2215 [Sulfodiicoccus acidiphilus]|uniref:DUF3211 domain-containing protein n=1 Tax=Sulfodiicoccus acidiphilus TaxID=1670455 RepID=A0A348B6M4_9CREN|nr:STK_08120 family protein [Sulfodiicoccus acidiphilus]BBD73826.1 hypothetical protein HS1genome_2215 [Sulfodiicoccus acidiphilus]GGT96464.1 hypothetical protein GCM10007116_12580 [Sulfodiicoccus acidiphilus]
MDIVWHEIKNSHDPEVVYSIVSDPEFFLTRVIEVDGLQRVGEDTYSGKVTGMKVRITVYRGAENTTFIFYMEPTGFARFTKGKVVRKFVVRKGESSVLVEFEKQLAVDAVWDQDAALLKTTLDRAVEELQRNGDEIIRMERVKRKI